MCVRVCVCVYVCVVLCVYASMCMCMCICVCMCVCLYEYSCVDRWCVARAPRGALLGLGDDGEEELEQGPRHAQRGGAKAGKERQLVHDGEARRPAVRPGQRPLRRRAHGRKLGVRHGAAYPRSMRVDAPQPQQEARVGARLMQYTPRVRAYTHMHARMHAHTHWLC